jgi:hypothetical protein
VAGFDERSEPPDHVLDEVARILIEEVEREEREAKAS